MIDSNEIETYEKESRMTKVVFSILLLVIAIGFIIGPIIVNNL